MDKLAQARTDDVRELSPVQQGVLTEAEAREFVTKPVLFPATRRFIKRECIIAWHRLGHWFRRRGLVERVLYTVAYLYLPVQAAVKLGLNERGVWVSLLILVLLQGRRAWAEVSPKHMQLVEKSYLERKIELRRLIDQVSERGMSEREVRRFRVDALQLIVEYVRSHRADLRGKKIFANLLIADRDNLVVIARNEQHRTPYPRYPREGMLADQVFRTGEAQVVGDLYRELPATPNGKSYKSILALPVVFQGKLVGVVSIDSQLKYHFDWEAEDLVYYLGPYVALLGWTLSEEHVKRELKEAAC